MISTTSPAAAEAVRPDEDGKPGWVERGIDESPDGKGRIHYWTPPGGCGNPASGEGLIVIQATSRKGFIPEPPYRIHARKEGRTLPGEYANREEAIAEAERVAVSRKARKNGGETPARFPDGSDPADGGPPVSEKDLRRVIPDYESGLISRPEAVSDYRRIVAAWTEEVLEETKTKPAAPITEENRKEIARLYRNAAAIHMDIAGLLSWEERRNTADLKAAERCNRLAERYDPDGV